MQCLELDLILPLLYLLLVDMPLITIFSIGKQINPSLTTYKKVSSYNSSFADLLGFYQDILRQTGQKSIIHGNLPLALHSTFAAALFNSLQNVNQPLLYRVVKLSI